MGPQYINFTLEIGHNLKIAHALYNLKIPKKTKTQI